MFVYVQINVIQMRSNSHLDYIKIKENNNMTSNLLFAIASTELVVLFCALTFVIGVVGGVVAINIFNSKQILKSKGKATKIIEEAYAEAKAVKKESILECKEEAQRIKQDTDLEVKDRRLEIQRLEERLISREESLSKKDEALDKKMENIEHIKENLIEKEKHLEDAGEEIKQVKAQAVGELTKISGMTKEEAKQEIIKVCEDEAKLDAVKMMREIEEEARDTATKKAKEIISLAIQKCAADHTQEVTVSVVSIPSEDIKGRIIGREGRNIRAIEQATGVELIIDDTPDVITLSGFDPVRREVARIALEKLILDGRIHPARIEELVDKVQKDMETTIKETGENAAFNAGIHNLHPELIKVLGRLKYRTSYGQNCLNHSLEVSYLAGLMASELGVDVKLAKRAGLLHDIGKAVDHEFEGTHISIGVDLARKYKESDALINCIEAHHGGVECTCIEAVLIQAADAISSARPGARRETLENYIKRLQGLEALANGFKGVEKSYAIQAGREIRVIVKPDEINDNQAMFLAKELAKKIEEEMDYPGQIKVNVIREVRKTEIAK